MDEWKIMSTRCYNNNYKLVALELHSSCFYTNATKLRELHAYMIPHIVS
jgi:hypothetical protein